MPTAIEIPHAQLAAILIASPFGVSQSFFECVFMKPDSGNVSLLYQCIHRDNSQRSSFGV